MAEPNSKVTESYHEISNSDTMMAESYKKMVESDIMAESDEKKAEYHNEKLESEDKAVKTRSNLKTAEPDSETTDSDRETGSESEYETAESGSVGSDYETATDSEVEDSPPERDDPRVFRQVEEGNWLKVGAYFQKAHEAANAALPENAENGVKSRPDDHAEDGEEEVAYSPHAHGFTAQMQGFWSSAVSLDNATIFFHRRPCRISRAVRHWAVQEAGKRADIVEALYIARHSSQDEGDIMLTKAVARSSEGDGESWRLVSLLLAHRLVSRSMRQWAVEEAARLADSFLFTMLFLPCCTSELNHDSVLRELAKRGDFELALRLIHKKHCSKQCVVWVMEQACTKASAKELSPLLTPEMVQGLELDSVMVAVAGRGLWTVLALMLRADCVANSLTRQEAVLVAIQQASSGAVAAILKNCLPEELDCALVQFVKGTRWHLVDRELLDRDYLAEFSNDREWRQLSRKLYAESSLCLGLLQQVDQSALFSLLEEALKQASRFKELIYFVFSREWYYTRKLKIISTIAPYEKASETCQRLWASNKTFLSAFDGLSDILQEVFTVLGLHTSAQPSPGWQSVVHSLPRWTQVALDTHARVKDECSSGERERTNTELFRDWEYLLVQLLLEKVTPHWSDMEFSTFGKLISVLALVPVIPTLQSVCLKYVTGQSFALTYFDLVGHTCWYHVPEEVRRFVFRTAVERGRWGAVTQLADHSLYDDERGWALGQAMDSGQWSAFLRLAQHGLNADQRRRVYRQVAKHGDWHTVQAMFERGADVRSVFAELFTANISRDPNPPKDVVTRYKHRLRQLRKLAQKLALKAKNFDAALKKKNWSAVLYKTRRGGTEQEVWQAMMGAMEARAWHVLIALVRGRNTAAQREELFPLVVKQQQWSVVRELLERRESGQLDLGAALQTFLESHEWLLAARVTEHDVTDSVTRHVMQQALQHREGSLVAHCVASLKEPLSVTERRAIFQQALSQGLWWAVRRLVEEKDAEAEREEALQSSAERQQWSVLTHCLQHGAHLDRRDREGNTLLHRWAQRGDWTGVVRLVEQGADHNTPDSQGYTALHRVMAKGQSCSADQGRIVETLIQYHGDLHRPDPEGNTAWGCLVSDTNARLIDTVLMWSRVDTQRVDKYGNTALHKVCEAGIVGAVRSLVARGNSPLAVNKKGMTALCSASTRYNHHVTRECIRLGVGTFQPPFTDGYQRMSAHFSERTAYGVQRYELASPFQRAAAEGDLNLMEALYQAGACSNAELHRFSAALKARQIPRHSVAYSKAQEMCDYVERRACQPRSLQSSCRLALCHQLGVRRDRERRVRQLDRLDDRERHQQLDTHMVHYLLFSDLEHEFPYPAELSAPQSQSPSQSDQVRLAKIQSLLATGKISFRGKMHDYYLREFMRLK